MTSSHQRVPFGGKAGWPGEQDLMLFEGKATDAAKQFPAVSPDGLRQQMAAPRE